MVAFVQFAVVRCGAPDRFLPPPKDRINELIGTSATSTTDRLTPPIKADQFTSLLDALEADGSLKALQALDALFRKQLVEKIKSSDGKCDTVVLFQPRKDRRRP